MSKIWEQCCCWQKETLCFQHVNNILGNKKKANSCLRQPPKRFRVYVTGFQRVWFGGFSHPTEQHVILHFKHDTMSLTWRCGVFTQQRRYWKGQQILWQPSIEEGNNDFVWRRMLLCSFYLRFSMFEKHTCTENDASGTIELVLIHAEFSEIKNFTL